MAKQEYKSRVYTDRPAYADFDAPAKFQAIQGIIATRGAEMTYPDFIKSKAITTTSAGIDVAAAELNPHLFDFQRDIVRWALAKGKAKHGSR